MIYNWQEGVILLITVISFLIIVGIIIRIIKCFKCGADICSALWKRCCFCCPKKKKKAKKSERSTARHSERRPVTRHRGFARPGPGDEEASVGSSFKRAVNASRRVSRRSLRIIKQVINVVN
eukprot:sb/3475926/